ncbi:MAG: DUF4142 domain-containing protein [Acidobacteriaceae bacterium]|nr:DUF4142 domain-containing protein [Acidobacteriaceae bacterium]
MKKRFAVCAVLFGLGLLATTGVGHAQGSDSDKIFVATAAQAGVDEIQLSELAETKTSNPEVKKFAQTMVTQHMELAEQIKPFALEWNVPVPMDMDSEHKAEYEKLNALSGEAFDKEYIDAMVQDHTKALELFTAEVSSAQDERLRQTVLKGKTVVDSHRIMAVDLQKKL